MNVVVSQQVSRIVTVTKTGEPNITIERPTRTINITKVGLRGPAGPAGDISQDPGDLLAIFLSA